MKFKLTFLILFISFFKIDGQFINSSDLNYLSENTLDNNRTDIINAVCKLNSNDQKLKSIDYSLLNSFQIRKSENVEIVIDSLFVNSRYYNFWRFTHTENIDIPALVAADQFTASWANFGMYNAGQEPRIPWDNIDIDNDYVTKDFYNNSYENIYLIDTIIKAIIVNKTQIVPNTNFNTRALAICYFIQGLIYGNLSLVFDKAMIISENANVSSFSSYYEVSNFAIKSLQEVINICDTSKFNILGNIFNSTDISNIKLKQLANSYIARFKVLYPRNKIENSEVDWSQNVSSSYAL